MELLINYFTFASITTDISYDEVINIIIIDEICNIFFYLSKLFKTTLKFKQILSYTVQVIINIRKIILDTIILGVLIHNANNINRLEKITQ